MILPWAGAATGAYAALYLWLVVASPQRLGEFYARQAITPLSPMAGVTGLLGLAGVLVGMGLTLRRLRHLRWLAWVVLILGPLSLLTSAFIGPEASYLLLLVLAIALAVRPLVHGPHARSR